MKLVHINLNEGILVDAINCTEWVIESPEYFSEYVMELAGQVEGKEGRFVLSDNEKEVDISKNVELIFNIFALDINERKLISKLYAFENDVKMYGTQTWLNRLMNMKMFENDVKMYGS